ncbi:hypothetical protein D3C80_1058090 [compost metagenome]
MAGDLSNLGAELLDVIDRYGAAVVLALDQHDHRRGIKPWKRHLDGDIEHDVVLSLSREVLWFALDGGEPRGEEEVTGLKLTAQVLEHLLLKEITFVIRAEFRGFQGRHLALQAYSSALAQAQ